MTASQKSTPPTTDMQFPFLERVARESGADYHLLAGIGAALGADPDFKMWGSLFSFLLQSSDIILERELIDDEFWTMAIANIEHAMTAIDDSFTGPAAHPLQNQTGRYPLLALLLQPAREESPSIDALKTIVASLALSAPSRPSNERWINTASKQIRLSIDHIAYSRNHAVFRRIFQLPSSLTGVSLLHGLISNANAELEKAPTPVKKAIPHFRKICTALISNIVAGYRPSDEFPVLPTDDEGSVIDGLGQTNLVIVESELEGEPDIEGVQYTEDVTQGAAPISTEGLLSDAAKSSFWIDQLHDPAFLAASALNHFETDIVEQEIVNSTHSDPLGCLIVLLVYTTGLSPEQVPTLVVGQNITIDGDYKRQVHRASNVDADMAQKHADWIMPAAEEFELQLPPVIAKLLSQLLANQPSQQELGKILSFDRNDAIEQCATWTQRVRDQGFYRVTTYRLQHTLRHRVASRTKDLALIWQLFGSDDDAVPVEAYYCAFTPARLAQEHQNSLREILPSLTLQHLSEVDNVDSYCGSRVVPTTASISGFTHKLIEYVQAQLHDEEIDYVARHNVLASYTALLLISTTGHRPVDDVFPNITWIDADLEIAFIEDKVVDEQRRTRLVALPQIACRQIGAYQQHLRSIAFELSKDNSENSELARSIQGLANGTLRQNQFPLLFLLQRTKNRILPRHMTIAELLSQTRTIEAIPMRGNWARHDIATFFRSIHQRAPSIAAHLGHFLGISHPYGNISPRSPAHSLQSMSSALDIHADQHKWKAIENPNASGGASIPKNHQRGSGLVFLPAGEKRARRRSKNRLEDSDVIRQLLKDTYPNGIPQKVSSTDYEKLLKELGIRCQNRPRRYALCAMVLWRWMRRKTREGHNIELPFRKVFISPEKMPFADRFINKLKRAISARERFIGYLTDQNRKKKTPSNEKQHAEVVVAAGLFGGLLPEWHLRALSDSVYTRKYKVNNTLVVEISQNKMLHRWIPTSLPLHLICRSCGSNKSSVSSVKLESELANLLDLIDPQLDHSNPYKRLSTLAKAYWQYTLPGFVYSTLAGSVPYTPLPESALLRMLTGNRLLATTTSNEGKQDTDEHGFFARNLDNGLKGGQEFLSILNRINNEILNLPAKGARRRKKNQKQHFKKRLREEINSKRWPSVVVCLAAWAIHLSERGTEYKSNIAYRTVYEYVSVASKPLIELAGKLDFMSLAGFQYEELYFSAAYRKKTHERRSYLANRLIEFHRYLHDTLGSESIDISIFGNLISKKQSPANANILLPKEYLTALRLIQQTEGLDLRTKHLYSAILMLGYRFGLRQGEIFRLRFMDFQFDSQLENIIIQVKNSLYGETKSFAGVRQVPLLESLTEQEKAVLSFLFDHLADRADEDKNAAVFSERNDLRQQIDRSKAVAFLTKVLMEVTGESKFRPHHLRRSWSMRIALHLFRELFGGKDIPLTENLIFSSDDSKQITRTLYGYEELVSESLRPLSIAMGHADISTTISHYLHILEFYAAALIKNDIIPEGTDHAAAYILGKPNTTVRQLRSRHGIKPKDLHSILISYKPNLTGFAESKVQVTHKKPTLIPVRTDQKEFLPLNQIEKLLVLNAIHRDQHADLASVFLTSDRAVTNILKAAKTIEQDSGYDHYGLNLQIDGVWQIVEPALEGIDDINSLRRGTQRLRDYLTHLSTCARRWDNSTVSRLGRGLQAWKSALSLGESAPVFIRENDARAYLEMLNLIGVPPHLISAVIPETLSSDYQDKISQEIRLLQITTINTAKLPMVGIQRGTKVAPIKFKLRRLAHPIAYERTLQRVLFVLSVRLNSGDLCENLDYVKSTGSL